MGDLPIVVRARNDHAITAVVVDSGSGFHTWPVPSDKIIACVEIYNTYGSIGGPGDIRFEGRRNDINFEFETDDLKLVAVHFERHATDQYVASMLTIGVEFDQQ